MVAIGGSFQVQASTLASECQHPLMVVCATPRRLPSFLRHSVCQIYDDTSVPANPALTRVAHRLPTVASLRHRGIHQEAPDPVVPTVRPHHRAVVRNPASNTLHCGTGFFLRPGSHPSSFLSWCLAAHSAKTLIASVTTVRLFAPVPNASTIALLRNECTDVCQTKTCPTYGRGTSCIVRRAASDLAHRAG